MKNKIYSFFRKSDDEDEMNFYNIYESHFIVKFVKYFYSLFDRNRNQIKTQKGTKKPEDM